ncbi:hypothetical protein COLO4_05839 [Corchorus olitorius]|uniref:Uncharacterized protein n=1 Tax=Corchorus olitorius TaxID=93759 RepID=A0A1R3KPU7_9ROSI|nr:hypothetical protein COLO4_05839 [Corchorus olitorius]
MGSEMGLLDPHESGAVSFEKPRKIPGMGACLRCQFELQACEGLRGFDTVFPSSILSVMLQLSIASVFHHLLLSWPMGASTRLFGPNEVLTATR